MRTTSGPVSPGELHRLGSGSGLAGNVDAGCLVDQSAQARADQRLVVGEDDVDGHRAGAGSGSRAVTRKPPPGRGPAEKSPPSSAARSRMPKQKNPGIRRSAPEYQPFKSCRAITMRWIWLVPS
jgi:hypothetical protein